MSAKNVKAPDEARGARFSQAGLRGRNATLVAAGICVVTFFVGALLYVARRHGSARVPRAALLEADRYTMAGRYEETASFLEEAIARYGRNAELLLRMGCVTSMLAGGEEDIEAKAARFRAARSFLDEASRLEAADPVIEWNLALLALRECAAYREAGRSARARAKLEEFRARARKVKAARDWQPGMELHLGRVEEMNGNWELAAGHYVAEINCIPDRAAAFHALFQLRREHPAPLHGVPGWYYVLAAAVAGALLAAALINRSARGRFPEETGG